MRVLILGGGGRENAIAWKIAQSKNLTSLHIAPGNPGTAMIGTNHPVNPEDFPAVAELCQTQSIDMVIVGPEAPLVKGIVDHFRASPELKKIKIIGPDAEAAKLEGSKDFAKSFMAEFNIPTASYQSFDRAELEAGLRFLESESGPYVLKADGLAAGKGVLILEDRNQAKEALKNMLEGQFGAASERVVIESFLKGREFSVFAVTDGHDFHLLPIAKDYKRIGEGDTGPNTGGMGAVSPVPFVDTSLMAKVIQKVVAPTVKGIEKRKMHFQGFLFFGLIEVAGEPFVIEYNVRMGDPETEVVLPRLETDLLELLNSAVSGSIHSQSIKISDQAASTVVVVSEGYPGSYEKGKAISGLEKVAKDTIVFHAGTKEEKGEILTNGGRVMALSAIGDDLTEALQKSYSAAKSICYEGIQYRKDIGKDVQ